MKLFFSFFAAISLQIAEPAMAIPPASHAFGLNGTYDDELGGSALVALGGKIRSKEYKFSAGQGLQLTDSIDPVSYSIEISFAPTEVFGYRRILDFKNLGSDTGLYILNGYANFYNIQTAANPTFEAGKLAHVVITRDGPSQRFKYYVNGELQISFVDSDSLTVFDGPSAVAYFFIDDTVVPGEETGGTLSYLRIFTDVLKPGDVEKLYSGRKPPNVTTK